MEEKAILTDWAYDSYREGALDALVKYNVVELEDKEKLERYVMVAIWCIQEYPYLRPTMRRVTQMLEGVVEVLILPSHFCLVGQVNPTLKIYNNYVCVLVFALYCNMPSDLLVVVIFFFFWSVLLRRLPKNHTRVSRLNT